MELVVDKTVRAPASDYIGERSCMGYRGPDHSTYAGACALLKRIKQVRKDRGESCDLTVVAVGSFNDEPIFGIRDAKLVAPGAKITSKPRGPGRRFFGGLGNARATAICTKVLESYPGVTIMCVLGGGRAHRIAAARRACIRAIHDSGVAPNKAAIARFFAMDTGNVTRALAQTYERLAA